MLDLDNKIIAVEPRIGVADHGEELPRRQAPAVCLGNQGAALPVQQLPAHPSQLLPLIEVEKMFSVAVVTPAAAGR